MGRVSKKVDIKSKTATADTGGQSAVKGESRCCSWKKGVRGDRLGPNSGGRKW